MTRPKSELESRLERLDFKGLDELTEIRTRIASIDDTIAGLTKEIRRLSRIELRVQDSRIRHLDSLLDDVAAGGDPALGPMLERIRDVWERIRTAGEEERAELERELVAMLRALADAGKRVDDAVHRELEKRAAELQRLKEAQKK